MGGDESQGVPLLASCHARIWTCAFAARASLLLNSNRLREQVCGRWKEVTKPGPPRGTPPRCKATWQDAGNSQVRGAQRRRRPSRLKSPRWRSPERSIATCLTPSRAHDRPDRAPHQPQRGDQRWRAWRGRTRGHARMQIGLRARSRQTRVSTPQPRPATRPARDGIASSLRSKPASAVATRPHQRAARPLDMPPASNAHSARQGRNWDEAATDHTPSGSCMYVSIVCARVCPSPWPSRSLLLPGGSGRARGTPSYLVGFARC